MKIWVLSRENKFGGRGPCQVAFVDEQEARDYVDAIDGLCWAAVDEVPIIRFTEGRIEDWKQIAEDALKALEETRNGWQADMERWHAAAEKTAKELRKK